MLQGTMLMPEWDVNPQLTVWPPENREERPSTHNLYPDLMAGLPKDAPWLNEYGVCDTVEQFLALAKDRLEADARTFVVTFTRIPKEPENKGEGGGWRWHKWGPYIGVGEITEEYLDDEEGFPDGVLIYHVFQVDGPDLNRKWL